MKCSWNVFWTDHLQMTIELMPLFRKWTRTWKGTRKGVDETHHSSVRLEPENSRFYILHIIRAYESILVENGKNLQCALGWVHARCAELCIDLSPKCEKKWNFMSFHKPFQHCCNCSSCTIHNHFRCRVPSAQLSGSLEKTFFRLVQSKSLQFGDVFHSVHSSLVDYLAQVI